MGFFEPVRKALDHHYPEKIYRDRLLWIPGGKGVLIAFKQRFYDVVKTSEGILVCLGRSGSEQHLEDNVRGILGVAQQQHTTPIQIHVLGNLYDSAPVIELVKSFGLETKPQISVEVIRRKVTVGKILCVSLAGKTSILTALERAGFSPAAISECFEEEVIEGARNSNLNSHLKMRAASFQYLIYAWEGARTISPEAKGAFSIGCAEGRSASQVVEIFKKWIIEAA